MTIIEKLRELKDRSGLTTKEIAVRAKLPEATLEKIFAGKTQNPGVNTVQQILYTLGYTLDDIPPITDEAARIAQRYEALDSTGRGAVNALINFYEAKTVPETKVIPLIVQAFAAGSGEPDFGDISLDTYEAPADSQAEFACRVHGDSLEPYLRDQDIALAVKRPPRDGEVGIWLIDGEYKIKQYAGDPFGNVYLFAVNRDRADTDQTLWAREEHTVYCLGTLLLGRRLPLP